MISEELLKCKNEFIEKLNIEKIEHKKENNDL